MPELPEVETVKRHLDRVLRNRRLVRLEMRRRNLRFPLPPAMDARLSGQRVEALARRAKYILVHCNGGDTLLVHLGMTGRFVLESPTPGPDGDSAASARHAHVVFHLDDGQRLIYHDPRRFGMMDIAASRNLSRHRWLEKLGPEPLDGEVTAAYLHRRFTGRRTALKTALLDQRLIAGLGNIYACESLHHARLSPFESIGHLGGNDPSDRHSRKAMPRLKRLVRSIDIILRRAIDAGGTTLKDFATPDGEKGGYQQLFKVYGREGLLCPRPRCSGRITRVVQTGRSTYYCPVCQRQTQI